MSKRYCVETDGDGHTYLIPAELREEFNEWYEWVYSNDGGLPNTEWSGTDFDSMMIDGVHRLTFTDPNDY